MAKKTPVKVMTPLCEAHMGQILNEATRRWEKVITVSLRRQQLLQATAQCIKDENWKALTDLLKMIEEASAD